MMTLRKTFAISLLTLSLVSILSPSLAQSKPTKDNPDIQPKALELLKTMSDRLVSSNSLAFTAITTYESPSVIGPPIVYTTRSEVILQRPNQLQVITLGDGSPMEFYYNGKTISAYAPSENLIAIAEVPKNFASNIEGALNHAYNSASVYFPFTDVIVSDPYKDITQGLKYAFVVGQSQVVGGTTTDVIVAINDQVFAQIWIGAEDKLPRMIRAIYKDDPSRLRHQVEFLNWQLNPEITANTFDPSHIKKALPIPFASPNPLTPSGSSSVNSPSK